MSVGILLRKSIRRLREDGPRNLWRRSYSYIYDHLRERSLGIETASWLDWQGAHSDAHCVDYEPLAYWHIERILSALTIEPGESVLLDYGCGKGRVLAVASRQPFQRTIGVELLDGLTKTARSNLDACGDRLTCREATLVTTDATQYELPGDVTHIFLFNPSSGSVLQSALARIRESWEQQHRTIEIAYIVPTTHENLLDQCEWLQRRSQLPLPHWQNLRFLIYETRCTRPDDQDRKATSNNHELPA